MDKTTAPTHRSPAEYPAMSPAPPEPAVRPVRNVLCQWARIHFPFWLPHFEFRMTLDELTCSRGRMIVRPFRLAAGHISKIAHNSVSRYDARTASHQRRIGFQFSGNVFACMI